MLVLVIVAGASLNTDIGPDSEAQIAPQHDDDYEAKDYDNEHEAVKTDIKAKHPGVVEKQQPTNGQQNGNNGGDKKTNTPV